MKLLLHNHLFSLQLFGQTKVNPKLYAKDLKLANAGI
jgi:hypothetical protein